MKERIIKEFKSWGIFLIILAIIYFTGLHKPIIIGVQRAWLWMGFSQPSEIKEDLQEGISYDFKIYDINQEVVDFKTFKNKAIFINVWATWCPPCVAELPDINALYEDMKDNPEVVFLMIANESDISKVKKFINHRAYSFPIYFFASNIPSALNASSLPTTFVISADGRIVSKKVGAAKYNTKYFKNLLIKASKRK